MKRFYSTNIQGNSIFLEHDEAQHCSKVLRCKINDIVEVLDGKGKMYEGTISSIQKQEVLIQIQEIKKQETAQKNKLSIAICPTKNPARLEWFLEKATEIGIDSIFPIISKRTEKQNIKFERLQHIIASAAKQSGQLHFPILHPLQPLETLLSTANFSQKFIAHCETEKQHLKDIYTPNKEVLVLIGPEGDFTSDEIKNALNKNYQPISLGNSILRVETAGVVACVTIQNINHNL